MSVTVISLAGMSATVIGYDPCVTRWQPNARGRLERAALELYSERGFEQTTVAEIAERAGLTERTFFRHFADKREVLFGGAGGLQQLLVDAVAGAPGSVTPIDAVAAGLDAAAALLGERRELAVQRQSIIAAARKVLHGFFSIQIGANALRFVTRSEGIHDQDSHALGEHVVDVGL